MDFPHAINFSVKVDSNGRVIEKNMLVNVRGTDLGSVVSTFQALRGHLNGDLGGADLPKLPYPREQVALAEPKESPQPNYPGYCERCGAAMVLKTARKGPRTGQQFWACCAYSRGCLSTKPA